MQSRSNTAKCEHLYACPDCDLLIESLEIKAGYVSQCPRCKTVLEHPMHFSLRYSFFCVFSGLILYFPAVLLPIMKFSMMGQTQSLSVFDCVYNLFLKGHFAIASTVFFVLMLAPLVKMILLMFISSRVYYHTKSYYLALCFKWYQQLNEWAMLDVFLLAMIVSVIKLRDDGVIEPGFGLYAFILLLLSNTFQTQLLNKKLIWSLVENHGK